MTPAAPDAPLVVVCGLDHANLAEEQEVLGEGGRSARDGGRAHRSRVPRAVRPGRRPSDPVRRHHAPRARRAPARPRAGPVRRRRGRHRPGGGDRPRCAGRERAGLRDRRGRQPRGGAPPGAGPQDHQARPADTERRLGRVSRRPRDASRRPDRGASWAAAESGPPSRGSSAASTCGCSAATRTSTPSLPASSRWPSSGSSAESDHVTIHCPLTAETRHAFDATSLRRMRPTAVLINTARGGIVDTAALVEALQRGLLAGAGLDVHRTGAAGPGESAARDWSR